MWCLVRRSVRTRQGGDFRNACVAKVGGRRGRGTLPQQSRLWFTSLGRIIRWHCSRDCCGRGNPSVWSPGQCSWRAFLIVANATAHAVVPLCPCRWLRCESFATPAHDHGTRATEGKIARSYGHAPATALQVSYASFSRRYRQHTIVSPGSALRRNWSASSASCCPPPRSGRKVFWGSFSAAGRGSPRSLFLSS